MKTTIGELFTVIMDILDIWKINAAEMRRNRRNIRFLKGVFLLVTIILSGCNLHPDSEEKEPPVIDVDLEISEPSYKDLFSNCKLIKLESEPLSMLSKISVVDFHNDSIVILDDKRSLVFLFGPDGKFLNRIGNIGEGPDEYYLCYDIDMLPHTDIVSLVNPMGELIYYTLSGKYIGRERLGEILELPCYYSCRWLDSQKIAIWSSVNEDEPGLALADLEQRRVLYEDWYNDRKMDFHCMHPLFKHRDKMYFAGPYTYDVYALNDSCMRLAYSWNINPCTLTQEYRDEIKSIENPTEKNLKLIADRKECVITDFPIFFGETDEYHYVALETGILDDSIIKSVFHDKRNGKNLVFTRFKEGMSFRPVYMNDEYAVCQVPYEEVDIYNNILGTHYTCLEDDNPILAKFYFKK